jgi:hypothetical protein
VTKPELEALINGGGVEACIVALQGMSEAERTKLGSTAVARLRELSQGIHPRLFPLLGSEVGEQAIPPIVMAHERRARLRAARAAVLATASHSQWKTVRSRGLPSDETIFRIMSDRRPSWLGEFVEYLCDDEGPLASHWNLIRRLVRAGYCPPPQSARYIDLMLHNLPGEAWGKRIALKDALLDDPELLEREIWRIFETEPAPRFVSLFTTKTRGALPETTWVVALTELAKEGRISRERLLDAALAGLARDFHEVRARWFALLHDQLEPTLDERAARAGRYVNLLDSRNQSSVAFALKVLKGLVKAGRIEIGTVVDRLASAMHARTKQTVKLALEMLGLAARATGEPGVRARAVLVATDGLVSESADIQGAILDLVERYGDRHERELREKLAERRDCVAVSLRGRLDEWLGKKDEAANQGVEAGDEIAAFEPRAAAIPPRLSALAGIPEALTALRAGRWECPVLAFDGTEIPRLDAARRIEPIVDLDTLFTLCLRLIEDPTPADDIDRCVDAISRLCDVRSGDFEKRAAPLAARVERLLGQAWTFSAYLIHPFGMVIRAWLSGEAFEGRPQYDPFRMFEHFFAKWTWSIAKRVAQRRAASLLAAPTHSGGWVDPRVLVDRFRECDSQRLADAPEDLILALLRLAPDHREEALSLARDLQGEPGAAIRHALGGQGEMIGPAAALWVAAARARAPWSDDAAVEARHANLGPDAGQAAVYLIDGKAMIPRPANVIELKIGREPSGSAGSAALVELPTVAYHVARYLSANMWPSPASVWPIALESFFAAGAQLLVEASESDSDWQGNRGFVRPLLDPDVPLREMARLLLAIALNTKPAEIAGLATDALIAAIDDGRLDGNTLGDALRVVWRFRIESWIYRPANDPKAGMPHTVPFVKPSRWSKALADAAGASSHHARVIARAIEMFLADEASSERTSASILPFLELLRETSAASGRALSEEVRTYLTALRTSGKTGRIVAELLTLTESADPSMRRKSAIEVLANRIARAERWMARQG